MIKNGYTSRNIPDPKHFEEVFNTRIKAKKEGDKVTSNVLKLVLNSTYGATLNKTSQLYDPLQARSVCISGQLYLIEIAEHLYTEVPDLKVVSLNTDAFMIEFDDKYCDKVNEIVNEWQERTGFVLEEDKIKKFMAANVNNYLEMLEDGTVNVKGGVLVRGIAQAGAFKINNNAVVIANAVKQFFTDGTTPEEFIEADDTVLDYQFIAKASHKYTEVWHEVGGEQIPCQRVNRVYASADYENGTLYKRHQSGTVTKESDIPAHCIIDNRNEIGIEQIDKRWYVRQAWKKINDFRGVEPPKVNTRKINSLMKSTLAML